MTGREKLLAAMSPQGSASAPLVICYPEIFMRDQWEKVTREPWWAMHSPEIDVGLRIHRDLLEVTGEDRVRLWMSPPQSQLARYRLEPGPDNTARRTDRETGEVEVLRRPPPGGFVSPKDASLAADRQVTSTEQIDELLPLPPIETAETLAADGRAAKPRAMRAAFPDLMPWTQISTPFDPLPFALGFEGLMMLCLDRPELVDYAAQRALVASLRRLAMWQAVGVELIWLQECMTDQISPDQYRRFNAPYLKELTSAARRMGLRTIYYVCGNPNDRLELLLESGADVLGLEEGKKGFVIDMAEVAEKVDGRLTLLGNLDAMFLLEQGPVSAIEAEVARQLEAGRRNGHRFIMGLGSPITPDTPLEHIRALARTVRRLAP